MRRRRCWDADPHTAAASRLGLAARSAFKLLSLCKAHPRLLPRGATVLDLGCSPGAFLQVASEAVGPRGLVFGVDVTAVDVGTLEKNRRKKQKTTSTTTTALVSSSSSSSSPSAPIFTCVADVFDLTPRTLSQLVREKVRREEQQEQQQREESSSSSSSSSSSRRKNNPLLLLPPPFSVVLSDLCHSTVGVRSADAAMSLDLARAAAELALGTGEKKKREGEDDEEERTNNGVLAMGGSLLLKILEGGETRSFAADLRHSFETLRWARPPATRSKSTEVYLLGLGRRK